MNYQKIYDDICKRGQERKLPKDVYTEKHHIIPKCMGGGNEKSNISVLTAREHFLVHYILASKLYPQNRKLWYAFWWMCNKKSDGIFKPNSKLYEETKNELRFWNSGENNPMFGIRGSSNPRYGVEFTDEHKKNMSFSAKERAKTVDHLVNFAKMKLNLVLTPEQKQRRSDSKKGVLNTFYNKKHTEKTKQQIKDTFEARGVSKGNNNSNATTVLHIETNLIFKSIKDAASHFNVTCTTIQNRIKRNEFKRLKKTNAKNNNNS